MQEGVSESADNTEANGDIKGAHQKDVVESFIHDESYRQIHLTGIAGRSFCL